MKITIEDGENVKTDEMISRDINKEMNNFKDFFESEIDEMREFSENSVDKNNIIISSLMDEMDNLKTKVADLQSRVNDNQDVVRDY